MHMHTRHRAQCAAVGQVRESKVSVHAVVPDPELDFTHVFHVDDLPNRPFDEIARRIEPDEHRKSGADQKDHARSKRVGAPHEAEQRKSRALWWDKRPKDLEETRKMEEGRVPQAAYVYQGQD